MRPVLCWLLLWIGIPRVAEGALPARFHQDTEPIPGLLGAEISDLQRLLRELVAIELFFSDSMIAVMNTLGMT